MTPLQHYGPGKIVTKIKLKFDAKWGSYTPHWRAEIYTLSSAYTFIPYDWSGLETIEDLPLAVKLTFTNLKKGGFYLDDARKS